MQSLSSVKREVWHWTKRNRHILIVLSFCPPAYFVPERLRATSHNPPVGVYIAVMGLLAVIVTFFRIKKAEKAAWIALLTLLVVAEVRNLYIADADQLNKFRTISSDLDATRRSLDATADGITATAKAIKQNTDQNAKHFSATMAESHEAISQITGGSSLSYVIITGDASGFVIVPIGDYSLYDLGIDMFGYSDKLEKHLDHVDLTANVQRPWFKHDFSSFTELNYSILFTARNREWWETLQLRKVGGAWAYAVKVEQALTLAHNQVKTDKPLRTKIRFLLVDPAYPKPNGDVEWCRFVVSKSQLGSNPCLTSAH
jgi:hypothetical protein